jgi:hypothetical protein
MDHLEASALKVCARSREELTLDARGLSLLSGCIALTGVGERAYNA